MLVGCCHETLIEPALDSRFTSSDSKFATEFLLNDSVKDFGVGTSSWYEGSLFVSIPTSSTYPLSTKSNFCGSYLIAAIW